MASDTALKPATTLTSSQTSSSSTSAPTDPDQAVRFSPEEENTLLSRYTAIKSKANDIFTSSSPDYPLALSTYQEALSTCPVYLHYPRAVAHSNIAACHLQLTNYKGAVTAATTALDELLAAETELYSSPSPSPPDLPTTTTTSEADDIPISEHSAKLANDPVIASSASSPSSTPLPSSSSQLSSPPQPFLTTSTTPPLTQPTSLTTLNITSLRTKVLLRRSRAYTFLNTWSSLVSAEEDCTSLLANPATNQPPTSALPSTTRKLLMRQKSELPARIEEAKRRETQEMLSKLKGLGDGLLKPFGLSTDMFKVEKGGGGSGGGEGGYSLSFGGGGK